MQPELPGVVDDYLEPGREGTYRVRRLRGRLIRRLIEGRLRLVRVSDAEVAAYLEGAP